jgi:hypothetical protein
MYMPTMLRRIPVRVNGPAVDYGTTRQRAIPSA